MRRCLGCMCEYDGQFDICPHCGYALDAPAAEAYHLTPGTLLRERYLIGRSVGCGGFGVTYIAWDTQEERRVAVKEYYPLELAARESGQSRLKAFGGEKSEHFSAGLRGFLDEGGQLAHFIAHPGIVDIYETFAENNTGYLVMEFLDGCTIKEKLARDGAFAYNEALRIILDVLASLREVHKTGLIHRDLAPDNIFLTSDGQVKLLDFGAARFAASRGTHSLTVILKQGYAPMEQYQTRGRQGPWTDVYALAATFYKMLTGVTPPDAIDRKMEDTIRRPSALGATLPKKVEDAVMRALRVDIGERFQSAEAFEAALRADRTVVMREGEGTPVAGGKRLPLWGKISAAVLGVVVIVSVVLAAGSGVLWGVEVVATQMPSPTGVLTASPAIVPSPSAELTLNLTHRIVIAQELW